MGSADMRGTALLSTILLSTYSSYANNPCSANPCGAGAVCSVQGGNNVICSCPVVMVLTVWQLATKLSVLVPRHIQETLLSPVVHLPRLTSATPTPVAPMPSVSQEWTILQGRTGLCASVRMATEVMG